MTVLDDARKISEIQPLFEEGDGTGAQACRLCGELIGEYPTWAGHEPDCSWLSMPKIVAALEAAERVIAAYEQRQARLTGAGLSPAASLGSCAPMHREVRNLCAVLKDEPQ